jgi:hypothetical protein
MTRVQWTGNKTIVSTCPTNGECGIQLPRCALKLSSHLFEMAQLQVWPGGESSFKQPPLYRTTAFFT